MYKPVCVAIRALRCIVEGVTSLAVGALQPHDNPELVYETSARSARLRLRRRPHSDAETG